ncbi:MAG: hypothetical protein LBS03_05900 [Bacteroidales bacterium]|jgi:hypothetical protein|nr:hypothetical protein [Bacteroidales bacterium]
MKKVSFYAVTAIAVVMGFSSCSNDDPAEPLNVNWNQTATVHGKVLIQDNFEPSGTPKWTTSSAVKFVATVPYSQLAPGASGTYTVPSDKITYNATSGEVTVEVPVSKNNITALTLKVLAFEGEVTDYNGDDIDVIWGSKTKTTNALSPGEVAYLETFKYQSSSDYTEVVKKGDEI